MDPKPATMLVRIDGGEPISVVPLNGELGIGRGESCAIQVDDEAVSRTHATLVWREGAWWISDRSRNGTLLNEGAVLVDRRVAIGDRIHLQGDVDHSVEILSMCTGSGETKVRCTVKSFVHVRATSVARIRTAVRAQPIVAPIAERPGRLLRALIEAEITGIPLLPEREAVLVGGKSKDNAYQARKDLREWWIGLCHEYRELEKASDPAETSARPRGAEGAAEKKLDILRREGRAIRIAVAAGTFGLE